MADVLQPVSHDRLPRLLQADWSGPTRLERAVGTLVVWERGALLLAATVIPTPVATVLEGRAWGFSSQERRPVLGVSLGLRVWTKGIGRVPLGIRLWPKGGPAQ